MDDSRKTDFLNSLLIVLVIYKMKIKESPAYQSLTAALLRNKTSIFIYDNSGESQELPSDMCWNFYYKHDPSNAGVSKAYNEGFKKAIELRKKWLLLVDQDTSFPINSLDSYCRTITDSGHQIVVPILKDQFGIVSPFKFYFGGGQRILNLSSNKEMNLCDFYFHNSGLLIAVDVFEKAGMYDERLPLDFSDIAFVCRLRKSNSKFTVSNFSCEHKPATSNAATLNERLNRFESYVSSSKYFKVHYSPLDWMLSVRVFLRSIKLSIHYKSFKFIDSILKAYD